MLCIKLDFNELYEIKSYLVSTKVFTIHGVSVWRLSNLLEEMIRQLN